MAEVRLTLDDVTHPETLPAVCVRCGRPARGSRRMRLTTSEPKRSSSWAWIFWEMGWLSTAEKTSLKNILHEWKITKGRLKLPVCWWPRWIAPPLVTVGLVGERTVVVHGAGEAFIAALRKQGRLR